MNDIEFRRTKYQRQDGSRYFGWSADCDISGTWDIQRHTVEYETFWTVVHNGQVCDNTFNDAYTAKNFVQYRHDEAREAEAVRLSEAAEEVVRGELQAR